MHDGRRRTFIDFSLTSSWRTPRELWEYISTIYRIAEPQHERTKAGDAFGELLKATEKKGQWTFTGDAIAIERDEVYRIVEPHVQRAKSNFLIDSKPPHKFFRRFAASNVDEGEIVARGGARIAFKGFPLIGWTRTHVWFGVTRFPQLWAHAADVRAHALAYPFRPLAEFLRLDWSPVANDWYPTLDTPPPVDEESDRGRNSGTKWIAIRNHPFMVVDHIGQLSSPERNRFSYLAVELGNTYGFVFNRATASIALCSTFGEWQQISAPPRTVAALRSTSGPGPEALIVASNDEQLRAGLAAIEEVRESKIFSTALVVTPMPIEAVAERTHVMQAQSDHPITFTYLTDELLVRYVRHFPWVLFPGASLRTKGETLPEELVMVCFFEVWRSLSKYPQLAELRACWQALRLAGDFDTLLAALKQRRLLSAHDERLELNVRRFEELLPTDSSFTALQDAMEDWVLERGSLKTVSWVIPEATFVIGHRKFQQRAISVGGDDGLSSIAHRIAYREMKPDKPWKVRRPHRAVHALQQLLEHRPSDVEALARLGKLHIVYFDMRLGIELLARTRTSKGATYGTPFYHQVKDLTRLLGVQDNTKEWLRELLWAYCEVVRAGRKPRFVMSRAAIGSKIIPNTGRIAMLLDMFYDRKVTEHLRKIFKPPPRVKKRRSPPSPRRS